MEKATNHVKGAFTLIELLVVIAIISILAAILFPVFGRVRENARRSSCQSNLKQIGMGIHQYCSDYDEKMPLQAFASASIPSSWDARNARWMDVVQPYIKSEQVFTCPSTFVNNLFQATPGRSAMTSGAAPFWLGSYVWNVGYWDRENSTSPYGFGWGPMNGVAIPKIQAPSTTINVLERNLFTNPNSECAFQTSDTNGGSFIVQNTIPTQLWDVGLWHLETTNVLYCDGHVKAQNLAALNHRNSNGLLNQFTMADDDN